MFVTDKHKSTRCQVFDVQIFHKLSILKLLLTYFKKLIKSIKIIKNYSAYFIHI